MNDCVFCSIAQKRGEAFIVHESTHTLALLDIYPATYGHLLVIPKEHYKMFDEMFDEEVLKDVISSIQFVCNRLVERGLCRDYTIIQNNGEYAEQEINHVHFHIIPRYPNDLVKMDLNIQARRASKEELQNVFKALK
ncbi:HIT domain protein [Bacillus sp. THAF10]|uniref:HIT family protein n=1 Tax=Bacillus sp. THAF10 TaxID=2587848 RepID=UPI0012683EEA|nr:HIT family protein [Bacillus sp. THAF10]QFT87409.1 HIT domain protein [Bacillus sp. THAF10]